MMHQNVEQPTERDRDELITALHHACVTAKRQPCVIGTEAHPSRWDRAHKYLDSILDELVGR